MNPIEWRLLTADEFWRGCEHAVKECKAFGWSDDEAELRRKFIEVYLKLIPGLGAVH